MSGEKAKTRRGSPLAILGLLIAAWISGRVMLWESPFPILPDAAALIANSPAPEPAVPEGQRIVNVSNDGERVSKGMQTASYGDSWVGSFALVNSTGTGGGLGQAGSVYGENPQVAVGHSLLWASALSYVPIPRSVESAFGQAYSTWAGNTPPGGHDARPPFAAHPLSSERDVTKPGRWSLDAWAFWREGSNSTAISQGRVPIYGASQVGASLQYRLAPSSPRDPRAYIRAYRALVSSGETEGAAGISARPIARVPVRAFAEVRVTDNAFGSEVRPAAFVVTELPPQRLPLGLLAEAYGQAGYVGGDASTPFADGQVAVTREVTQFDLSSTRLARLSVGAAAWGGAQKDATRLDLGPTMRLDVAIGEVPARISVDWREQVAGDASPGSGAAVTLSTRF